MTTITIDRALLEQALEALWQMTKKFNFERLHESRLSDSEVRVSAHDAMNAIRAELAKPVERKPMTTKELEEEFFTKTAAESPWAHFVQGARAAEAHHKIGVKT